MKKVIVVTEFVGVSKTVKSECLGITFVNPSGGNTFEVNGVPVQAGQNYVIRMNENELDVTQYSIVFLSGIGTDLCYISRIVYVGENYKK